MNGFESGYDTREDEKTGPKHRTWDFRNPRPTGTGERNWASGEFCRQEKISSKIKILLASRDLGARQKQVERRSLLPHKNEKWPMHEAQRDSLYLAQIIEEPNSTKHNPKIDFPCGSNKIYTNQRRSPSSLPHLIIRIKKLVHVSLSNPINMK
jgi:hypothetical protein